MSTPFYEKGRYLCRITSQALGAAKTGTPQFVLRFQVIGLIKFDGAEDVTEYERTAYLYITEKTIKYFMDAMRTLGFHGSSFKDLDPNTDGYHDFTGIEVAMYCDHESDLEGGGSHEKWGVAKQSSDLDVAPLDSKKLRDLDNLFGKDLKAIRSAPPPQAKPQPAAAMATADYQPKDEDCPF